MHSDSNSLDIVVFITNPVDSTNSDAMQLITIN